MEKKNGVQKFALLVGQASQDAAKVEIFAGRGFRHDITPVFFRGFNP
ncbi:MAG TPA: hypothetical protein VNI36_08300 [Candidatus Dormibacteraeota bacterium]|nr:hypothetical protein [Candidatus Dormibacteraeota bacterium]